MFKIFALLGLLAMPIRSQQIVNITGPYSGLNNTDSCIILSNGDAQAALNVEVSLNGTNLKKRAGYSEYLTLPVATAPIRGSIYFRDSAGNQIDVFANDKRINKSANGAAFTTISAAGTAGAYWTFCEYSGIIYGFSSANDAPIKYDGTTFSSPATLPNGTMCSMSVDRMWVAGSTTAPNRLYYSASGSVENFTAGTDPEDSNYEDVGLAGEKITGVYAINSEIIVSKTSSILSFQFDNQYSMPVCIASDKVGVLNPTDMIEYEGLLYLKGTDNRLYIYQGCRLDETSKKIRGTLANIAKGTSTISEIETTQAEFQAGLQSPSGSWDTTTTPNSLQNAATSFTETNYGLGTYFNISTWTVNAIPQFYAHNTGTSSFFNQGGESGTTTNWTGSGVLSASVSQKYWGTYGIQNSVEGGCSGGAPLSTNRLRIYDTNGNRMIYSSSGLNQNWQDFFIDVSTFAKGISFYIIIHASHGNVSSPLFVNSRYIHVAAKASCNGATTLVQNIDMPEESLAISSGSYTSQVLNTGFSSPVWGVFSANGQYTGAVTSPLYIQSATSAYGSWQALQSQSTGSVVAANSRQYIRYVASYTITAGTETWNWWGFDLSAASTGTYTTSTFTATSPSSWGAWGADGSVVGNGTFTISGKCNNLASALSTTTYTAFTNNTVPSFALGSNCLIQITDWMGATTDTVRIDQINLNYLSGAVPERSYAFKYDKNIYYSMSNGLTQSTNNLTMKMDLLNSGWYPFDIPINAPVLHPDNSFLFGSTTNGKIYKYPQGDSDAGAAIDSYWKTKNFAGDNPYVEKTFSRISLIAGAAAGSTLDATYTINMDTATTYSILLTSSTREFIHYNQWLPTESYGSFFNLQIGNNAVNQPWNFYGASIEYVDRPWQVMP